VTLADYSEVVVCDFEYHHDGAKEGPPVPVCCCAKELRSGRKFRLWEDDLKRRRQPPYAHGPRDLFVSYNAPAELTCYLALRWPIPRNVLDLCIEYRQLANGVVEKHQRRDLLSAMRYLKLSGIEAVEKDNWRDLILTGGPFDRGQRAGILDYCWSDVAATEQLLQAMAKEMPRDLQRALYRGRYTVSVAATEMTGIPVDEATWKGLLEHRELIQEAVIADISQECPVYEGTTFRLDRFGQWLEELGLLRTWPRRSRSTRLCTDDETFKTLSWHPQIERLRQVRQAVQQLRKPSFHVQAGRNYYGIIPFKAESSRNATAGCIFQAPSWLRGLIQPKPGTGLIYADYVQEEFYIGGVLSGDAATLAAYESGDPYLNFAAMAGLVPAHGTKAEYPHERGLAKTALLAIQYGMKAPALAIRLGVSRHRAEDLLSAHHRGYPKFWKWSDRAVTDARWTGNIETVYGWKLAVNEKTKENTIRNFKVQGCGAEILRLAGILLWEAGIPIVAPVHDAFLAECAAPDLVDVADVMQRKMTQASEYVLNGSRLRTDVRIVRFPDRLIESRGLSMWNRIQSIENRVMRAA
jgi:DNA polymerase-1